MFAGYYSVTWQLPMATVVHLAVFVNAYSAPVADVAL